KQLQDALTEIRKGVSAHVEVKKIRFSEYAASLFEFKVRTGKIKSAKSREKWESILRLHLVPAFGDYFVDAITKADIKKWLTSMGEQIEVKQLHPNTANDRLATFKVIMNAAGAEFEWERDPLRGIEPFD